MANVIKFGGIDYSGIPDHMRDGARLYIEEGYIPGDFLYKVLCNDLVGAYGQADMINSARMRDWAQFLYNEAPKPCWGSTKIVAEWNSHRGLRNEPWPSQDDRTVEEEAADLTDTGEDNV